MLLSNLYNTNSSAYEGNMIFKIQIGKPRVDFSMAVLSGQ